MSMPSFENPFETDRLNRPGDYRPDWDVPSLCASISKRLDDEIERIRRRKGTDPAQKIMLLLGTPGYGKTHLFGRLQHAHGERVAFLSVPNFPIGVDPIVNVRWYVVESLFQAGAGQMPLLTRLLGRLLQPSFQAYLDQLPATLATRHQDLRQRLRGDWTTVPEMLGAIPELPPYHRLADSLAEAFPELQSDILRALVLGLSPASDDARRWLRGELPVGEQAEMLRLGSFPRPLSTLHAVAALVQQVDTPVVLCLDQLEGLLDRDPEATKRLFAALMVWLHEIPNLLIVIGCVQEKWTDVFEKAFEGFTDRVEKSRLELLTPDQAVELVCCRLRSWDGFDPSRHGTYPFKEDSIRQFVQKTPAGPRGFIKVCSQRFTDWLAKKDGDVRLGGDKPEFTRAELFLQEWNKELEAIRRAAKRPVDFQEAELYAGVREAIHLASRGGLTSEAIKLGIIKDQALKPGPQDGRPGVELELMAGDSKFGVVVAVSKTDQGVAFGHYYNALTNALGGNVVGAVMVWPEAKLRVGKTAKAFKEYSTHVAANTIRPFALDTERLTFEYLECLRQVLLKAAAKDIQLGGKLVTPDECRQLILETKQLDNLPLFKFIFEGWPAIEKARAQVPTKTAVTPPPAVPVPAGAGTSARASGARVASDDGEKALLPIPPSPAKTPPDGPPSVPAPPPPPAQVWADELLTKVVRMLCNGGQPVTPQGVAIGPTFVRLKVVPHPQADVNKIRNKAENLRIHLNLDTRPLIAGQPGHISIDLQRPDRQTVTLGQALATRPAKVEGQPAFPVGIDVAGQGHWLNLADPPSCHLLIAGTTGSGKSEFMKAILAALAHELPPESLQLLLIDPKQVTFNLNGSSPYLPRPIAYDIDDALPLIQVCFDEMERRYTLLRKANKEHVGQLTGKDAVARWVLIFDEFADLMLERKSKKEVETLLKRLGAKARAAGIHLILGTQRTEASVVTPLLRSNLPARISLKVISERDSMLILEAPDAASLLGRGDLLWRQGAGLTRLQSPLVPREEIEKILRLH